MRFGLWCLVGVLAIKTSVQREDVGSAQAEWGGHVYNIRIGTGELDKERALYLNCTTSSLFRLRTEERWITADALTVLLKTTSISRTKGVQGLSSSLGNQLLPVVSLLAKQDQFLEQKDQWVFATKGDESYFKSLLQDVHKCVALEYGCKYNSQGLRVEDDDEFSCGSQQALAGPTRDLC